MLIIKVHDIDLDGLNVHETLPPEEMGLTKDEYLYFIRPIKINAHLKRVDNLILCHVQASSRFRTSCYRTLKLIEKDWSAEFDLDFEIDQKTQEIEIGDDIRQEVLLSLPMRVLSDDVTEVEDASSSVDIKEESEKEVNDHVYKPFADLPDLDE